MPFLRRRSFASKPASCSSCSRGDRQRITVDACASVKASLILLRLDDFRSQSEALFPTSDWCTALLLVVMAWVQQGRGRLIADLLSEHHQPLPVILALRGLRLVRYPKNFGVISSLLLELGRFLINIGFLLLL